MFIPVCGTESVAYTDPDVACFVAEPCEKTYCAYGANCVQTPEGRAECQCPTECPAMFTPVCGTDGVTYTNHCMLRMKSCREEKNTRVQHAGDCGKYRNFSRNYLLSAGSETGRLQAYFSWSELIFLQQNVCPTQLILDCFATLQYAEAADRYPVDGGCDHARSLAISPTVVFPPAVSGICKPAQNG